MGKTEPLRMVIVASEQYGYNPSTYYHSKYLSAECNITYIGWDHGLEKVATPGVHVEYVPRNGGVLRRTIRLLRVVYKHTDSKSTIIFLKYFKVVNSAVRLLRPKNPIVLDIQTGSVETSGFRRLYQDVLMKAESRFFKNITVISRNLAEKLRLGRDVKILPIGAEVISKSEKSFQDMRLLYVGTLFNRNIERTIQGVKCFHERFKDSVSVSYTIIGDGPGNELSELKKVIKESGLQDVVRVLGRLPHDKLEGYFDENNMGVSYVPITDYYDVQPVTKTFEYLLSGMPVLGTSTSEHKYVVNKTNGILTDDTPKDFCRGLIYLYGKREEYDSKKIREDATKHNWEKITKELIEYLYGLLRTEIDGDKSKAS